MVRSAPQVSVLIFATLLALTAGPRVWSADTPGTAQGPDVLVVVRPLDAGGEAFRQVIADAVRNELESRGLAVGFSQVQQAPPGGGPAAAGPVEQARSRNAPVAIDCAYSLAANEIAVTMGWYETRTGTRTAGAESRGRMGLRLDEVFLKALDSVLAASESRVRELAAARILMNAAGAPADRQAGSGGDSGQQQESVAPSGGAGGSDVLSGAGTPSPRKKSSTRLLVATGFAPFIATGAASYYFTLGYLPSMLVSLVFDTAAGRVGLGLYGGMNYFTAQGTADSSNNFMIPVGADVRYELALSRLLFSLHFTGGPATLVVQTTSGHTYVNVMPFLKSGIGAEFLLTQWLGISLTVDYEIYFEVPYLFMGITPSLGMTFRL
jgi:hypothetical protein